MTKYDIVGRIVVLFACFICLLTLLTFYQDWGSVSGTQQTKNEVTSCLKMNK